MWYAPIVVVAAESEPLTVSDVKSLSVIDYTGYEAQIGLYIAGARDYVEQYCGTRLVTQTLSFKCDKFGDFAALPLAPVQSVASIEYVDSDGSNRALDADVYELRADGYDVSIALKYGRSWPIQQVGSRVSITLVVGYSVAFELPPAVKSALILRVQREFSIAERNLFISQERIEGVGERRFVVSDAAIKTLDNVCADLLANHRARFVQ